MSARDTRLERRLSRKMGKFWEKSDLKRTSVSFPKSKKKKKKQFFSSLE